MKCTFSLLLAFVLLLALPSANCFASVSDAVGEKTQKDNTVSVAATPAELCAPNDMLTRHQTRNGCCNAAPIESANSANAFTASCTPQDSVFTVNFYIWNGTRLSTQDVECGKDAIPPTVPFHNGYTFKGWDKPYTNVQSDLDIHAVYKESTLEPVTIEYFAMGDTLLYCLYLNRVDNTTLLNIFLTYDDDVLEIMETKKYGFVCLTMFDTTVKGKVRFGAAAGYDGFFSDTEPTCIILKFAIKDKSALTTTIDAEIVPEETGWYYYNVTHTTTVKLRE